MRIPQARVGWRREGSAKSIIWQAKFNDQIIAILALVWGGGGGGGGEGGVSSIVIGHHINFVCL